MRISSNLRRVLKALTILAFALLASTCSGQERRPSSLPSLQTQASAPQAPIELSLDEATAELEALETPEGVTPDLFQQLKDELAGQLRAKRVSKVMSKPPTGDINLVNDLTITDNGDGTYTLSWYYRNLGDYDQNGMVSISDITAIAMHFGEIYEPDTEPNSIQAVIDGSGNGAIDIADITPLAVNFGSQCAGYLIRGSATGEDGSFFAFGNAPLESATPAEASRRQFSFVLTASGHRYVHVVAVDTVGMTGEPSNIVELPNPRIMSISPSGGDEGTMVTFFAQVSGDAPLIYDWEFDAAAEPSTSQYPSPTVTLGAPGNYTGYLTVTNALGESSRDFSITVNVVPKWHVSYPHDYSVVAGQAHALAVVNGAPAVAYTDLTTGRIMYVLAYDPHATVWRPPKVIAYGENPSLEVINGNPAIAYVNSGSVMYIHATDVKGEYWSNRVEVMSAPDQSSNPCLAQVGGYESPTSLPAIAIAGRYEMKYARASSEDGATWEEAVILDAAQAEDTIGEAISMKVVDEAPAIAYLTYPATGETYEASLKCIRAADELGSAWLAPVVVDGRGTLYACFVSMAVVNGNPAIAYVETTNHDLAYARALDAEGQSWGNPLVVNSEEAEGWGCALAVVGGYPAVAFGNGGTFYVRALDENGENWGSVELTNSSNYFYVKLVDIAGAPAISFYDYDDADIRLMLFY